MENNNEELMDQLLETTKKQAEYINRLISAVEHQTESIQLIQNEVAKKPSRGSAIKNTVALGLVILLIIGGFFWRLQSIADTNKNTLITLKDCIEPTGGCAQRGQASQGQAILAIVCNEERIIYTIIPTYNPLPECIPMIEKATGQPVVKR